MNDNNLNQVPISGDNQQNMNLGTNQDLVSNSANLGMTQGQMSMNNGAAPEIINQVPVNSADDTELLTDESINSSVPNQPMNNGMNPGMVNQMPMNNGMNPGMPNQMPINNGMNPGMPNQMPINNGMNPGMPNQMPMNNGMNPGMVNQMPMNSGMNQPAQKSNTGLIIAIVIISIIVVALIAFIGVTFVSKSGSGSGTGTTPEAGEVNNGSNIDDNGTTDVGTVENENTQQITHKGYTFTVDKNIKYQLSDNEVLVAVNAAQTAIVQLTPASGAYSTYEASSESLKQQLVDGGYGEVTYSKATHDGREYMVFKGAYNGVPFEFYIVELDSSNVIQGMIITKSGTEFADGYALVEDFVEDAKKSGSGDSSSSFGITIPSTSDFVTSIQ